MIFFQKCKLFQKKYTLNEQTDSPLAIKGENYL